MDFNDVPLFVRVVEAGSFTEAARVLGKEKSSVSRSVARLEEDLGVRLLQRTTRKLALTDAGQAFFERVRGAVSGVEEAASAVSELGSEPRGIVRMTAPADADALGIGRALAAFVTRYPKIHVEVTLTSRAVDLVAEGFDLAVRGGKLTDSSLVVRRIGNADIGVFAAPSYLERRGRPKKFVELSEHECVLFKARAGRLAWTLLGPSGEETTEVHGSVSADDMSFVASVAASGLGLVLLPIAVAARYVDEGALERVLPDYAFVGGSLAVVLPTSSFVPSRVALLRDFLVEALQTEMASWRRRCADRRNDRAPSKTTASRPREPGERARRAGGGAAAKQATGDKVRP
ncbi:MAG TPA: LysR family transcriptional regulator [Polyangiaceae bacterium]|nr:LysR family transcriptional regulator [Polyangiaceae bacterium]